MKAPKMLFVLVLCLLGLFGMHTTANAQPMLAFTRAVNNWPTIELYFKVACDGQATKAFNKNNFLVRENGIEIDNFVLSCHATPCPMSVSLVFDASGSMSGAGNAGAKAAGNAFVDMMDGQTDEASVIWFTSTAFVELRMTTNKTDLHDAINSLPALGATAVWDGIYVGVMEMIQRGTNDCRAVVAMTDGNDNSSRHTPDEIIALANRHGIRVYTVGLGSVSPAQLETIALLTGGKYYQAPSASQLATIYQEIFTIIRDGFSECMITYDASCPDGSLRNIDLTLKEFCSNGTDTKTRSYRAPKDTAAYTPVEFNVGSKRVDKGEEVILPVTLDTPLLWPATLYPFTFTITFDGGCLNFDRFEAPLGTLLSGAQFRTDPVPLGGVIIQVDDPVVIQSTGILGYLHLTPAVNPADSAVCPVTLDSLNFAGGCLKAVLNDGEVTIFNSDVPFISAYGSTAICAGDSLMLGAIDGFTDYRWSNGMTGQTIWVSRPGTYSATAKNGAGEDHTSNEITVTILPLPSPGIYPDGVLSVCPGTQVTIQADGGYVEYRWSTGDSATTITATRAGTFYYTARTADGCWGKSDVLTISYKIPDPEITGPATLCGGDGIATYAVQQGQGFEYKWTVTGGTLLSPQDQYSVNVAIQDEHAVVRVEVYDPTTGCRVSESKTIERIFGPGDLFSDEGAIICEGDSARLWVTPVYDSYEWSDGSTKSSTYARTSGEYFCKVTKGPCTFYTDTLDLLTMDDVQMSITGDNIVCQYGRASYSAPQVGGMTYWWRLEGESTDARWGNPVTLQFGGGETARVILRYGPAWCSDSVTLDVNLVEGLKPNVFVYPDSVLCEGDSITLEASPGFSDYRWNHGGTTQSIVVKEPGLYSVSAVGPNGCRATSDVRTIDFRPRPGKPRITAHGDTLVCDQRNYVYEWYLNGTLIPGEAEKTLIIKESGSYTVRVYDGGCYNESDPFAAVGIGRYAPGLASKFDIAPNPTDDIFRVSLEFSKPTAFTMQLVNVTGQVVFTEDIHKPVVSFDKTVRLGDVAPGLYFFMLQNGNVYDFRKVVVRTR